MPDSPFIGGGLLDEFRRRLGDTQYVYVQCEVTCNDSGATRAYVEVTDSQLITTIEGGSADSFVVDFQDPAVNTIEKMVNFISKKTLYEARVASSGEGAHAITDLEIMAPKDCLRRFVQLRTRRWSDSELTDMLSNGLTKLGRDTGTSYSLTTVPSSMKDLMFLLGSAEAYWDQVNNTTKRMGVDLRIDDFRTLHQAVLDEYDRSISAFKSTQPTPINPLTPEQLNELGAGEIIVGTQIRRNLRTGRYTPSSAVPLPAAGELAATFIGGAKVQLVWTRNRFPGFHHYEIWRGTTIGVSNISEIARPLGSVAVMGTKILMGYEIERAMWIDGGVSPLPPGEYFYRLYVYTVNGEYVASEVVSAVVV